RKAQLAAAVIRGRADAASNRRRGLTLLSSRRVFPPSLAHFARGDFPQRGDHFAIVGLQQGFRPGKELFRAFGGKQRQLKTIGNFLQTIFHSNPSHKIPPHRSAREPTARPAESRSKITPASLSTAGRKRRSRSLQPERGGRSRRPPGERQPPGLAPKSARGLPVLRRPGRRSQESSLDFSRLLIDWLITDRDRVKMARAAALSRFPLPRRSDRSPPRRAGVASFLRTCFDPAARRMPMATLYQEARALLRESDFRPRKSRGQNFLVHERVLDSIVRLLDLSPGDEVLEIGPGLGFLTRRLLERAGKVWAVEIDLLLVERLRAGALGADPRLHL